MSPDARTEYARVRALVQIRLAELRTRLDEHEAEQRWDDHAALEEVERGLAELVSHLRAARSSAR